MGLVGGWLGALWLAGAVAGAAEPAAIKQWVLSRPTPSAQLGEVARFGADSGGLSREYAAGLAGVVRSHLARRAAQAVSGFASGTCAESSQLRVIAPGSLGLPQTPLAEQFEASLFRLESTGCLAHGRAEQAEAVYLSTAFRLAEMPGLAAVDSRPDGVCLRSGAVPGVLEANDFCLKVSRYAEPGLSVLHAALSENRAGGGAAPMFYREEVLVFAQVGDGVGVYRATWTRGQELGTAGRMLLQRTAASSQTRIYRALETWMAR